MSIVFEIDPDLRFRKIVATAGQTMLAIVFPFQDNRDVAVLKRVAGEFVELAFPADYALTGAGESAGGAATLTVPALAGDVYLVLGRAVLDRLTSITQNGRYRSSLIDAELDRNRIIQQEHARDLGRALKVDFGDNPLSVSGSVEEGRTLIRSGGRLIAGPNAAEVANAQGYALIAQAAAASVPAEVGKRVVEFDIRMSQFAGGAKMNGIDDDQPAIQAAVEYSKTLGGRYTGGMVKLRIPRGQVRLTNSIDLFLGSTTADNITFEGEGPGSTTINLAANLPAFKSAAPVANSLYRAGFRGFTIYGPGRAQAQAHGFDINALNGGRFEDIEAFACRRAYSLAHQYQTTLKSCRAAAPRGNALSCYDGIYLKDGQAGIFENAVEIVGGKFSGMERYGFRGESVTGSNVLGLEILDCGAVGVYIGDSPLAKDLKWFTWQGGLIDTCGDLLTIHRGGSAVGEKIHFSGLWMGYADTGGGQGGAIEVQGLKDCVFRPDVIFNVDFAFSADACERVIFDPGVVQDYDRSNVGTVPVVLNNCNDMTILGGSYKKLAGSISSTVISETGTSNGANIQPKIVDGLINANAASIVKGIKGYKTRNSGSASISIGSATVVVNHGLNRTPTNGDIVVVPQHMLTAAGVAAFAVDTITATQFTIRVNANVTAGIGFSWQADASRG